MAHTKNPPWYTELLRRYTKARMSWLTVKPIVILNGWDITERQYADTYVLNCFPPFVGYQPGPSASTEAYEEAFLEVFH